VSVGPPAEVGSSLPTTVAIAKVTEGGGGNNADRAKDLGKPEKKARSQKKLKGEQRKKKGGGTRHLRGEW